MTIPRLSGMFVWLTVLWVALWADVSVANVVSGMIVAAAILAFARTSPISRAAPDDAARISPLATLRLAAYVTSKLVQSSLLIAWEIVTPHRRINTGIVALKLRTDSEAVLMGVANLITSTPGTITIEVDGSPPTVYVNVLHLHDLDRVRADLARTEELVIRAFGSRSARAALDSEAAT